jgi:aerotaxis receptor
MRNNQPITQREHELMSGAILVSRTNEQGRIVYCNEDFVTVSGYSREELMEQPHNIVRHPDMPPEAFRDMWNTLKSGRPWSGLVKNRRKNGDHYWVRANVNPHSGGGYRSVRTVPSRAEISAAETLYTRMRSDDGITLHEGKVFKKGIWKNLKCRMEKITIAQRLLVCGVTIATVFSFAVFSGWMNMISSRDSLLTIHSEVSKSSTQLVDIQKIVSEKYYESEARLHTGKEVLLLLVILGGTISCVIGLTTLRRLKRGFATAQAAAQSIAEGNLTCSIPVEGQDEIGQLVAQITIMRNNLQELIGELRNSLVRLSVHSNELRTVAENSAQVAESQSEAASSIAAAVEQLSVSIDQVENHAGNAHQITLKSADRAFESASEVENIALEMQNIATAVQNTSTDMRALEGISNEISSVVKVIREVADQTNLLALNAAIEAARAGEQGRGFAVVADEVRRLAEKTNASSSEITQMIVNVQNAARTAVVAMDNGVKCVDSGVILSHGAASKMTEIRSDQTQVTQAVDGIAHGLTEQAEATRHIAARLEKVSQGTEDMVMKARQTNEAATHLEHLTLHLEQFAANFRVV